MPTKLEVTPEGILTGFVSVEKPFYSKMFKKENYACSMLFTDDKSIDFMKSKIDNFISLSHQRNQRYKKADPPYYFTDQNELIVKFKKNSKLTNQSGQEILLSIKFYDHKKKELTEELQIGEGTRCKIAYNPYMWQSPANGCGVTLQPHSMQILELVRWESDDPFDEEEGMNIGSSIVDNSFDKGENPFDF